MPENEELELLFMDADERMDKSVEVFRHEAEGLRTGRANPAMLEDVRVELYGTVMPLNQVATITAPDARMLMVQPFDRGTLNTLEKELLKSDIGLTPNNDGQVIRLPIPPMTQERRQDMVRRLRKMLEETNISIRNVRRDTQDGLRAMEKNKQLSQDELRRQQERLQKLTDAATAKAAAVATRKEAELMEV
ncbi:MAG: ribosome recycling factor [Chloroflexota bacterium]